MDARAKAASLAIWRRPVEPEPVGGGITNANFLVDDGARRCFVRIGDDIPVHHIVRWHELAASRAAHAAGSRRPCCMPSRASWSWIWSRAARWGRRMCASAGSCAHRAAAAPGSSRAAPIPARADPDILGLPRPARLCGRAARPAIASLATLPDLLARAERLERAVGPIDLVFGHNDLLAANLIDDGRRLWLVDWDYGGWNSPLFDLGGLASNSELAPADRDWLLEAYFDRPLDDGLRRQRPCHADRLASARGDVEHGLRDPLAPRLRLRRLHGGESRPVQAGLERVRADAMTPMTTAPAPADAAARRAARPVICYPVDGLPAGHQAVYARARHELESVYEVVVPPRDGRCFRVPAGCFFRIKCSEGPQVGDLNLWSTDDLSERFYSGKTRALHGTHLSVGDRLWSCLPYLRPMATITHDTLSWYGFDEFGASVHDVIGTRCDPYTHRLLSGGTYHHCCHSNLSRAVAAETGLSLAVAEAQVHDVFNVFMCTGFTRDRGLYFMKASPRPCR